MLLTQIFGLSLSALTVWGFLMALFINVLMHFTTNQNRLTSIITAFFIFLAYFIADDLASLTLKPNTYLSWAIFDLVTVCLIFFGIKLFKQKFNLGPFYVILGLIISSVLFTSMHIDIDVMANNKPWFLWNVFAYGGTFIDFTMITVLILNKDVFGLYSLYLKLRKS